MAFSYFDECFSRNASCLQILKSTFLFNQDSVWMILSFDNLFRISGALLFTFLFCVVYVFVLFIVILCLVCPLLPVSLDCPFLTTIIFSNVDHRLLTTNNQHLKVVPYISGKIWSARLIFLFFGQCVWIYPL